MYLAKTPSIVKPLAKDFLWHVKTNDKVLYLTFDDGPTPDVTDAVLDLLSSYHAKATFFCVGQQVELHPDLFQQIEEQGHTIGNHSYDHNNGWKTDTLTYLKSYINASKLMPSKYYRPPYGRISSSQSKAIKIRSKIVMWDVLSGDFDTSSSPEQCADRVISNAKKGSIIVYHDSIKAKENMLGALKATLAHFSKLGYTFDSL